MIVATPAQNRATQRYKQKTYKRVALEIRKEDFSDIEEHIKKTKESLNGFIRRAIFETIERDDESS